MALSPFYNWSEPDNSSLVKNGAADIRTLGDAIDTSVWNVGFGQAGKNKAINGDFFYNQRQTTSTTTTNTYLVDRFRILLTAAAGSVTGSVQQFTAGTAPVAGYEAKQYCRVVTTGQAATTDRALFTYAGVEDVRTFAGQTVTLSFWAKAATGTPSVAIDFAQSFGTGGSPSTAISGIGAAKTAITTSWARYSFTVAIPSISGKTIGTDLNTSYLAFGIWLSAGSSFDARTASLGVQNNTFDIWGVQLEYGSKATPFQTASGGSPQAELAMCQRYYWRVTPATSGSRISALLGATSGTDSYGNVNNPVPMRTTPTSVDYSALNVVNAGTSTFAVTSITNNATLGTINNSGVSVFVASGLTTGQWHTLQTSSSSGYIGFSAEL